MWRRGGMGYTRSCLYNILIHRRSGSAEQPSDGEQTPAQAMGQRDPAHARELERRGGRPPRPRRRRAGRRRRGLPGRPRRRLNDDRAYRTRGRRIRAPPCRRGACSTAWPSASAGVVDAHGSAATQARGFTGTNEVCEYNRVVGVRRLRRGQS